MNSFKKAAIATSVITLMGIAGSASAVEFVNLGCAASPAGTTGATVYSVDAYDANGVANSTDPVPSIVRSGTACSRAINALQGNGYTLAYANNQTIQSAGYSLQNFTFVTDGAIAQATNSIGTAANNVALIGCAAAPAGTTGATVYSVDAQNSSGTNTSILTALIGQSCSSALATVADNLGTTGIVDGVNNVTIANSGYSLNQWIVQ